MTIVNHICCHRYIFQIFNIVCITKQHKKNSLLLFLTVVVCPKNIEGNFSLILDTGIEKKIEITKAAANYITQYQLNLS